MNGVAIRGVGAISPAGWGIEAFESVVSSSAPVQIKDVALPQGRGHLPARLVPAVSKRPDYALNPRLRRTSPVSHYATGAAYEAFGDELPAIRAGELQVAIISCHMCGCVSYSRRFYGEVLTDPMTASPLLFPETVFNAPASHLSALVGNRAATYTLVGDPGILLVALALAGNWLIGGAADRVLVVGAEEMDWLLADALRLFDRNAVISEGAGAIYLAPTTGQPGEVLLDSVTDPCQFTKKTPRAIAASKVRSELGEASPGELLCDSLVGTASDRAERQAWDDWEGPRISVKKLLGEAFMASAAWQCVAAVRAIQSGLVKSASINVVGCNQQAIACRLKSVA